LTNGKLKIGIAHPRIERGGSEARVMWSLEALKNDFDVSLITACGVEIDKLNRFYGTTVKESEFHVLPVSMPGLLRHSNVGDALRGAFFQRYCRKAACRFDAVVSAYNLCDFGIPAIHFIADFSWDENIRKEHDPKPCTVRGIFHRSRVFRKAYLSAVGAITQPSGRNLFGGEDLILANSLWSAGIMKEKYGIDVDVVYPPVQADFIADSSEEREVGFVCIGRISPEKRVERIIAILKKVRGRGHDIHLHVIGEADRTPYGRFVQGLCEQERDWVVLEGRQFGAAKNRLLTQHCFGIHGRSWEPFGISVAEMVKAGCIVWVPNGGGQVEIVDHPLLIYNSLEDAVFKIEYVLKRNEVQRELREHLANHLDRFSTARFVSAIREVVSRFFKKNVEGQK
jgi:glycosyltransferase involved in cell wall biosynthesis